MSLQADEVHKPVGKPSAERSTSKEEGADKDRKTVPKTAFSRSRAAGRQGGPHSEGPTKATAELRARGRPRASEERNI